MASPNPTLTHEARTVAWRKLWAALLAEPPDDGPASDTTQEEAEEHRPVTETAEDAAA